MISRILTISPGLIIAFLIYIISHYLSDFVGKQILGYEKSPISTILFAIILGIIVGNTFNINKKYIDGLNFSTKFVLRLGIVLMGIKLSLSDIFFFGLSSIPLIVICILSVIIVIYLFRKIFNISPQLSYLIAIGTSICGATAIVATAPVINAKKGEITYAIANITIFGIIVMFLYPYMSNFLFDGDINSIGLFLGTSIHETGQVIAAGLIYEQQFFDKKVLEIATITKLVRNSFLIIMIPLIAYIYSKREKGGSYSFLKIFPFFVVGFLIMAVFRSIGDFTVGSSEFNNYLDSWELIIKYLLLFSGISLGIAMSALGLMTNIREIVRMGYKPFFIGLVAASMVGLVSFITIFLFIK